MRGPMLWLFAILAALQTLTAGGGLSGVVGAHLAGFISLCVASLQSGLVAYLGLQDKRASAIIANSPAATSVSMPDIGEQ